VRVAGAEKQPSSSSMVWLASDLLVVVEQY